MARFPLETTSPYGVPGDGTRPQAEHVGIWKCDPILREAPRQDKPPVNQRWLRADYAGTNRRRGACGTSQTIQRQHLELLHDQHKPHGALEPKAAARAND